LGKEIIMGVAVRETTTQKPTVHVAAQTSQVMGHALMFVGGFTLVFVALGVTAGILLGTFSQGRIIDTLIYVGGVLLVILGIHMLGVVKWLVRNLDGAPGPQKFLAALDYRLDMLILPERRKQAGLGQSPGYIRSGVVGMAFAAGWTPCIGPLLGAIFGLSLNASRAADPTGTLIHSGLLFFAYALGLGVPFLAAAWALSKATTSLKNLNRYIPLVEKISAFLLIGLGLLLLFGSFSELNQLFANFQPAFIYEAEDSLAASFGLSVPIAFAAGLLSFLSPCVLPLVPVYVGYLTGVTAAGNNIQATA
jgi:cytochrome c-type biogenesis protein